jgi:hypothetical protein
VIYGNALWRRWLEMFRTLLRIIRFIIFYFVLLIALLMVSCSVAITFETPPTDKETAEHCKKNTQGFNLLSDAEKADRVGACMEDAWKGDGAAGALALLGYLIGTPILVGYLYRWVLRRRLKERRTERVPSN